MSKTCWKHFKISDLDQDFDPLSNIDEIANSDGHGFLKKNAMKSILITNTSSKMRKFDKNCVSMLA